MSEYFFIESNGQIEAFYCRAIHGNRIPSDAIRITEEKHKQLLNEQSQGAKLVVQSGVPQAIFETLSLDQQKEQKKSVIRQHLSNQLSQITNNYSLEEMLTWPVQESEAISIIRQAGAETPLIDAMADASQTTKVDVANRILAKAQEFKIISGTLLGVRRTLENSVNNAISENELNEIDNAMIASLLSQQGEQ